MSKALAVALLLVPLPLVAQGILGYRAAFEAALRCVDAAISDAAGVAAEQLVDIAISHCSERIDAAARAAIAGSDAERTEFETTRAALRKEFRDYAMQAASGHRAQSLP